MTTVTIYDLTLPELVEALKNHVDGIQESSRKAGMLLVTVNDWESLKEFVNELDRRMKT